MAHFVFNDAGMKALFNGPEVRAVNVIVATKAKAFAVSISPVETGDYKGSFEVTEEAVKVGRYTRPAARLRNTSDHAAALEFGNRRTRGRAARVLGKTLAAIGRL